MTCDQDYDEAIDQYVAARHQLQQWATTGDGSGPAADVTDAENRMAQAAYVIAAAVVDGESRR